MTDVIETFEELVHEKTGEDWRWRSPWRIRSVEELPGEHRLLVRFKGSKGSMETLRIDYEMLCRPPDHVDPLVWALMKAVKGAK